MIEPRSLSTEDDSLPNLKLSVLQKRCIYVSG